MYQSLKLPQVSIFNIPINNLTFNDTIKLIGEHIEKRSACYIIFAAGVNGFHTCVAVEYFQAVQIQNKDWVRNVAEN